MTSTAEHLHQAAEALHINKLLRLFGGHMEPGLAGPGGGHMEPRLAGPGGGSRASHMFVCGLFVFWDAECRVWLHLSARRV
jgi:hypothetical protein